MRYLGDPKIIIARELLKQNETGIRYLQNRPDVQTRFVERLFFVASACERGKMDFECRRS